MNLKNKKYMRLLIIGLSIVLLCLLIKYLMIFNDNIEYYKFNIGRLELVSEIEKFKKFHPKLNPSVDDPIFGNVSYDYENYLSPIYFYYPENKYILKTYVFENGKNKSSLGLEVIIDLKDDTSKRYKDINLSLGYFENQKQLKLFEERIVNPLHKQIREKYKRLKQKK